MLLVIALFKREALVVALIVCVSLLVDRCLFEQKMTYAEASEWATMLALKDIMLAAVITLRQKTKEFPLALGFFVSSFIHQIVRIESNNEVLALINHRADIMAVIVAAWLASISLIILSEGGNNGGKRVRRYISVPNATRHNRFNLQAREVKS